jgi:hypothetical protein
MIIIKKDKYLFGLKRIETKFTSLCKNPIKTIQQKITERQSFFKGAPITTKSNTESADINPQLNHLSLSVSSSTKEPRPEEEEEEIPPYYFS